MNILEHLAPGNDAPALVFTDHVLSYAALSVSVTELAQRMGHSKKLVALEAQPRADFVIAYLAALSAGHAVALLPPGDAAAAALFHRDFAPDISFALNGGGWQMTERSNRARGRLHPDLAVMLATSGSEGRPRWVRLSRASVAANAASIMDYLGLTAQDRAAQTLPFHYSYGLSVLNSHLAAGGSLAFCGASLIADGVLDAAARLGCTSLAGVPYSFELLERIGFRQRMWPALRSMTCAGGRLAPDLVTQYAEAMRAHGGQFFVMYGQTEATARMAYLPPGEAAAHPDCVGIAIPGGTFRIDAACGEEGELFYRGPNVMMGYATARADLARGAELDELATGDIAVMTEAGLIRLVGRAKRFSKLAGLRIGHEAIEWSLRERGIACAVTGNDEAITVHAETTDADVIRLAAEAAAIPQRFIRLARHDSLPRLASGKIDYRALSAPAPSAAATPARDLLQDVRAAFYPRPVTPQDSFESLEGDSLAYVQVSLAVEARLGQLPNGWEAMPIATLEAMADRTAAPRRSWFGKVESHIVLRAAAILLIVLHHASNWPIPGGAMVLMMLVGYGFARFHREPLFEGRVSAILHPMMRNLLPYFVVIAGFALAWEQIPWASLFLVGNLGFADPAKGTMLPFQYWFVEAYAQLCLVTALAFSFGSLRRAVARQPFATAFVAMIMAFGLRYGVPLIYDIGLRKIFLLSYVLWLPLLGWAAYFAQRTSQKLLLLAALAVISPAAAYFGGNWTGAWVMNLVQLPVMAMLLFLPAIRLPRLVLPGVMLVAASSYHIYLFHLVIPELLQLQGYGLWGIAATVAVGLVTGIAAATLQRLALASLSRKAELATREA
ncbi:AMP-dependent synthetase [Aestuariivirga litoralis]|uniref:AMP-dependent synthetase n=1 Tax=Aestuariivirga litoralis TaxID=2650924 RepID=A0A2W2BQ54_9HYPH|nr:AMP-binding protein [Aestuariivirga litoralis]PZF75526.1 AMP-dependent synthetase [Aestuariivirga litoralis]